MKKKVEPKIEALHFTYQHENPIDTVTEAANKRAAQFNEIKAAAIEEYVLASMLPADSKQASLTLPERKAVREIVSSLAEICTLENDANHSGAWNKLAEKARYAAMILR